MKRWFFIVLIACIAVNFSGCGKKEFQKSVIQNGMDMLEVSDIGVSDEDTQPYWGTYIHTFAKAEGGYYYIGDWNTASFLLFFDEETQESYPVCGKADCNHADDGCNAYVGREYSKGNNMATFYLNSAVYYYKENLYLLDSMGYLVRFSPDGSQRERIAIVSSLLEESGTNLVFYDDYVYVYSLLGHLGSEEEATETIKRYSLKDKSEEVVVEYTGNGAAISAAKSYGDRLYFLIRTATVEKDEEKETVIVNESYNGLYAYEYETGKAGKVLDANITDYCINEETGDIYYYQYNDGLYNYNVKTKETKKLLDADESTRVAEISFDGEYIYIDNRFWVSTAKRNSQLYYDTFCSVVSPDGTLINTIDCTGESFAFFGDEQYMFTEIFAQNEGRDTKIGFSGLGYIKKEDIKSGAECVWKKLEQEQE